MLKHVDIHLDLIKRTMHRIKYSNVKRSKYEDLLLELRLPNLAPVLDVPTRWNSTYAMLVRAFQVKPVGSV